MRIGVRFGIDVGEARVGVARSDPDGILATPVTTLQRDHEAGADLDELSSMLAAAEVVEVVVGSPQSLDGADRLAVTRAQDYAAELHRRHPGVSVRLVDERLTTVDGHRMLRDSGVRRSNHRSRIDQAAAVLILQTALDHERTTGRPAGRAFGSRKPRTARARQRRDEG